MQTPGAKSVKQFKTQTEEVADSVLGTDEMIRGPSFARGGVFMPEPVEYVRMCRHRSIN